MINKRKKNIDPMRIHNHNKLLHTIDKNMPIHLETENNVGPIIEWDKTQLDKMIHKISSQYFSNQYNSPSFTGQTNTHMSIINEPNKEDTKPRVNHNKYIHKSITTEIIQEDINNIDEVLIKE